MKPGQLVLGTIGWRPSVRSAMTAMLAASIAACSFPPLPPLDDPGADGGSDAASADDASDGRPTCARYDIAFVALGERLPPPQNMALTEIFAIDSDGTGARNLSRTINEHDVDPAWSSGGDAVLYTAAGLVDPNDEYRIVSSPRDGVAAPVTLVGGNDNAGARPSPRDARFTHNASSGTPGIWVRERSAAGAGIRISDLPAINWWTPVRWSPDATALVTSQGADPYRRQLYVLSPSGMAAPRPLGTTTGSHQFGGSPWDPTGAGFVFSHQLTATTSAELWIGYPETGGTVQITSTFSSSETDASWSPDGDLILFRGAENGDAVDLFTMRPDGSQRTNLTRDLAAQSAPSWSPDGREIIFVEDGDVLVMARDGTQRRNLTRGAYQGVATPVPSPCLAR